MKQISTWINILLLLLFFYRPGITVIMDNSRGIFLLGVKCEEMMIVIRLRIICSYQFKLQRILFERVEKFLDTNLISPAVVLHTWLGFGNTCSSYLIHISSRRGRNKAYPSRDEL